MNDVIEIFHRSGVSALFPALLQVPSWIPFVLAYLVGGGVIVGFMAVMALIWTYGERRIAGFIQVRLGPNRVGPLGILQPLADAIKLLAKEDIVPTAANWGMFTAAPILVFLGAMLPFAVLPFSERVVLTNMQLGLYFALAFQSIEVIGILMAGWGPGSKWSLYGGMRLAAQMLSYEIPMGLCVLVIVFLSGTLNLGEIVTWQSQRPWILGWAIFRSPAAFVSFFMFYVGGLAAAKRAPFDLPEAESELVAGYHTEYSGLRFAFFFMSEYAAMYVICALAAILFLGGWHGPIPRPALPENAAFFGMWLDAIQARVAGDMSLVAAVKVFVTTLFGTAFGKLGLTIIAYEVIGAINMAMKTFGLYFVMIWIRWTLPRIRIDQVMYLCLKVLLPIGIVCATWAAIQVVVFP
jgi:NADH-quinone oxidoreductase subunit H